MQNKKKSNIGYDELLQIINQSPIVTIIWRNNSKIQIDFVSENFEQLTGYSCQDLLSSELTLNQIIHPEDVERVRIQNEISCADAKCDKYELESYRILTSDGEIKTLSEQTFIKRDEAGKIIHYQTTLLDISDKKYGKPLGDNDEGHFSTLNAISDAVLIYPFSEKGYKPFIEVNDAACDIYGYSREELSKLTIKSIVDLTDAEIQDTRKFIKDHQNKKNIIFETVHRTKSGVSFPVEINSSLIDHHGQEVILCVVRDITDRKKIEESLRITQYSLDKAAIGAFCLNPAGEIYNVNDEAARMLGYTKEELESLCLFDLDPMVTPENYDEIWQVLVDNGANYFESFHQKKDGTTIPVEIYANILEYEGKTFSISFSKDISKRKKAEKALQDNLLQLQAVYKSLPITLWATDENGVFTLSEGLSLKKQNLKPGELVGKSVYDSYKEYPDIIENLKAAHKGESREYDTEVHGTLYHCFLTPILDEQNNLKGTNGIAIDVSDKRKAEEELLNLQNYLRSIINSMPSIMIGVDSTGNITQWNKTVEDCTKIPSGKASGEKLSTILPQLKPEMEKIEKSINYGEIVQEHKRSVTIDKNALFEEMTIYPLLTNSARGAVIRIDDITDKVRMEELMIQSEKMLSVGGLAAGMAHEINNPLASMLQTVSVLSNRISDNQGIVANRNAADKLGTNMNVIEDYMKSRDIDKMIVNILESGKRIADIVENMLSFSRKSDDYVSSHDLEDLLDKTLTLAMTDYDLKKNWDFKKIKITREYEQNLTKIPCEMVKIQQVLLNLLKNGAQAMQEAGTKSPEFIIRTYKDKSKNMVCIDIEDNGPGMNTEISERIFEPFFTTKPIGVGTGLGLSVSYFIIVENHKGKMEVNSKLGRGTIFTIRLPIRGASLR